MSVTLDPASPGFLRLDGIAKSFGHHAAVHPLSLDIAEGEYITLLGPSGCGKTTLLRMIAGLEQPSAGRIQLSGKDVTRLPPERRPFNMVFQNYALFPHLSVFDNVAYGPRGTGVAETEVARRVRAALAMVRLDQHLARPVDQLSGGMSQRVALVRAIVCEPRVLLLDEPLAALDLQLRKRMQVELRAIQERIGTTFIHVTHDQEEALALSDRIVLMREGRVEQIDTPRDLYEKPRSRFAAEFLGEASLLPCLTVSTRGREVMVELPGGATRALPRYGGSLPKSGDRGLVALRPQHLVWAPAGAGPLIGTVQTVIFAGHAMIHSVLVEGAASSVRVATAPGHALSRGTRTGLDLVPGSGVFLGDDDSAVEVTDPD